MPEARPLHVVVRDLTDALRAQRLPAEILPAIPPAGRTGQPLPFRARLLLRHGPIAPGMVLESLVAQRRELGHELLSNGVAERGGDADVVQRAMVVVEAEQERAHHRAGALLVPAEAGDHAVGRP